MNTVDEASIRFHWSSLEVSSCRSMASWAIANQQYDSDLQLWAVAFSERVTQSVGETGLVGLEHDWCMNHDTLARTAAAKAGFCPPPWGPPSPEVFSS